ncbi:hypothetical protein GCM10008983_19800 [Lentibacillus halophilus]|uniref:Uncharacterized protein n=1 Tax=Lentibacillus halophilus TaxID=295065 RepID=A0ABP3J5D7_9BACI
MYLDHAERDFHRLEEIPDVEPWNAKLEYGLIPVGFKPLSCEAMNGHPFIIRVVPRSDPVSNNHMERGFFNWCNTYWNRIIVMEVKHGTVYIRTNTSNVSQLF